MPRKIKEKGGPGTGRPLLKRAVSSLYFVGSCGGQVSQMTPVATQGLKKGHFRWEVVPGPARRWEIKAIQGRYTTGIR